ncbi:hypothetical protein EV363DRAFT_1091122, partial [Boletus edulis]
PNSVAGLCGTLFKDNFTVSQRLAASRALLRHGAHIDGTDNQTRTPGGLHPSYFGFREETEGSTRLSLAHEDFKEVCTHDLFDAVVQQDHLDGGISVLLRCPGFTAQQQLAPEDIVADVYITPHVLHAAPQRMSEGIALLVQGFCQEMALPHLHEFTKSCDIEDIAHAPPITLDSPPFLPPAAIDGTRIRCSAQPYVSQSLSSSISNGAELRSGKTETKVLPTSTPRSQVRQRRNAERFSADEVAKALKEATSGMSSAVEPTGLNPCPIISLGPNTDAVLDRFGMSDQVIPRLHRLVATVRSSRWEVALRNSPWNLNYEQAANLQKALYAD